MNIRLGEEKGERLYTDADACMNCADAGKMSMNTKARRSISSSGNALHLWPCDPHNLVPYADQLHA